MSTTNREHQLHFLNFVLEGKREFSDEEILIRKQQLNLNKLTVPCFVACVYFNLSQIDFREKDKTVFELQSFISHFFQKNGIQCYVLVNAYENIQIIVLHPKKLIHAEFFTRLHEKILLSFGIQTFIGIGSEADEYRTISISSSEAFEMLGYKFQFADRGVIDIDRVVHFRYNLSYSNNEIFNRVIGCFQDGDLAKMSVRLEEMIAEIRYRPSVSGTSIKRSMVELTVHMLHIASNSHVDVDKILGGEDPYSWIMKQEATEVITEWFMNLASALLNEINLQHSFQEKKIIQDACEYINEHIDDFSLGLQPVSENAGLSAPYFSQLFKKETGLGVSNYITKKRVEQAKNLLINTTLKNELIALQLGFSRANYFSKVFKKETGFTPADFRKQNRANS